MVDGGGALLERKAGKTETISQFRVAVQRSSYNGKRAGVRWIRRVSVGFSYVSPPCARIANAASHEAAGSAGGSIPSHARL